MARRRSIHLVRAARLNLSRLGKRRSASSSIVAGMGDFSISLVIIKHSRLERLVRGQWPKWGTLLTSENDCAELPGAPIWVKNWVDVSSILVWILRRRLVRVPTWGIEKRLASSVSCKR